MIPYDPRYDALGLPQPAPGMAGPQMPMPSPTPHPFIPNGSMPPQPWESGLAGMFGPSEAAAMGGPPPEVAGPPYGWENRLPRQINEFMGETMPMAMDSAGTAIGDALGGLGDMLGAPLQPGGMLEPGSMVSERIRPEMSPPEPFADYASRSVEGLASLISGSSAPSATAGMERGDRYAALGMPGGDDAMRGVDAIRGDDILERAAERGDYDGVNGSVELIRRLDPTGRRRAPAALPDTAPVMDATTLEYAPPRSATGTAPAPLPSRLPGRTSGGVLLEGTGQGLVGPRKPQGVLLAEVTPDKGGGMPSSEQWGGFEEANPFQLLTKVLGAPFNLLTHARNALQDFIGAPQARERALVEALHRSLTPSPYGGTSANDPAEGGGVGRGSKSRGDTRMPGFFELFTTNANDRYDDMHSALIGEAMKRREGYRQQKARAAEAQMRLAEMKAGTFMEDREYKRAEAEEDDRRADAYLAIARQNAARGGSQSTLSVLREKILSGALDPATLPPYVRQMVLGGGGGTFGERLVASGAASPEEIVDKFTGRSEKAYRASKDAQAEQRRLEDAYARYTAGKLPYEGAKVILGDRLGAEPWFGSAEFLPARPDDGGTPPGPSSDSGTIPLPAAKPAGAGIDDMLDAAPASITTASQAIDWLVQQGVPRAEAQAAVAGRTR